MQSRTFLTLAAAAVLGLAATAPSAHATSLAPGTDVVPAATTLTVGAAPGDVTLVATAGPETVTTATFTATFTETIYRENTGGTLDFVYQVTNSAGSKDGLEHVTGGSYSGFATDVYYDNSAAGTVIPSDVNRSGGSGSVVSFNFVSPGGADVVGPGQTSALLIVKTNSLFFGFGTAGIIDGSSGSPAVAYGPATPEPSSVIMGASAGLIGLGVARLRRRKASA